MKYEKEFNTNRETWNKKVEVHAKSDFYNLEGFKSGTTSLKSYELNALGNVSGKSMLHLQCHFGQDTLSWARHGAKCTGVDISDKAIELAKELNEELGLDASFVCCNVLDTSEHIQDTFDIVFTSYGVVGWIPDLRPWAEMIVDRLKPGGTFYLEEFHPIPWMFDYQQDPPVMRYGYQQKETIYEEYEGTYAHDGETAITSREYAWNHGIGEVVSALIEAGLTVDYLREYDESPYDIFPNLVENEQGMFHVKNRLFPLIFEIKARK